MPTIEPIKRTQNSSGDIVWNIIDIIDDYIVFKYLDDNIDLKNKMIEELTVYVKSLSVNKTGDLSL